MGTVRTLFAYKLRFFFGPSLRGRFGPLPFLGLVLLFLFYGFLFGFGMGAVLQGATPEQGAAMLGAPLSTLLSLALLYSLGAGVTSHASEFDFFMTAGIRPRDYLFADLLFQFTSLLLAGGIAGGIAGLAMVLALGRPLWVLLPLLLLLLLFAFFVLMAIQILVVLRVRYPKAPVRLATLLLFVLSMLPAVSLAAPGLPLHLESLPLPASAFGSLGYAFLSGTPADLVLAAIAGVEFAALAAAWFALSGTYIFHGIHPTMSAGFGQIDMMARMDQQRRIIGGLGKVTTRIHLHTERGGPTSLMARYHLIRIWRDGSILFVLLFAFISIFSVGAGGSEARSGASLGVTQLITLIPAILAINWSYYERENLWLALVSGEAPRAYFRGLAAALSAIGLLVGVAFLAAFQIFAGVVLSVEEIAMPIAAPVASAILATALLTRLRIRPASFSPSVLLLILVVIVGGFLGGFGAQGIVILGRALLTLGEGVQALLVAAYLVVLVAVGTWAVARLGASFRL